MARMPGATWRPIPASSSRMSGFDIVCIHTMVMALDACDSYFRSIAPGVNAHFGTGHDGTIYQWVDTTFRSGANYNGNGHIVSIENADRGPGFPAWDPNDASQVPAFTDAQIDAIARICAWAHQAHGIPLELIPDARPGRRGIGWHRQGVPGYMVPGAEQWSTKQGKACPGNRRIAQIPQIVDRARQITAGTDPTPPEEDLLAAIKTAVVFASPKSGDDAQAVYECSMLNGTRVRIKDPQTVKDRIHWLKKCGIPFTEAGEVDNIDAFGVDITPPST